MSGLVTIQRECRRTQSRSSPGVSPSYAAGRTDGSARPATDGELVAGQGLRRRQVEHAGAGVLGQPRQGRQLVGQRLARRRPRGDHDVPAVARQLGGIDLVPPGREHPACLQPVAQRGVDPLRPRQRAAHPHRHVVDVRDRLFLVVRARQHRRQEIGAREHLGGVAERSRRPLSHLSATRVCEESPRCDPGNRTSWTSARRCDLPYTRAASGARGLSTRPARRSADPGCSTPPGGRRPLGGTHAGKFAVRRGHGAGRRRPRHLPGRPRLRRLPGQGRHGRRPGHGEDARDRAGGPGGCGGLSADGSSARSASSPSSCSCSCWSCPSPRAAGGPGPGGPASS